MTLHGVLLYVRACFAAVVPVSAVSYSGGGGGSDSSGGRPAVTLFISKARFAQAFASKNGTTVVVGGYVDSTASLSTFTLTVTDASDNQVIGSTAAISGASGRTTGTLAVAGVAANTLDTYSCRLYVADSAETTSNALTGSFRVIAQPWSTKTVLPVATGGAGAGRRCGILGTDWTLP